MASTRWSCKVDANKKATLTCELDDPPIPKVTFPVKLRGVCYSPAPMNASNEYAPGLGDWYWDSFQAGPDTISGWQDLWTRDWGNLEALGAFHLRVYCMISRQKNGTKENSYIPDPWNVGHLFTHSNFLDKCWQQGAPPSVRKVKYVMVGLPVPAEMLWKNQYNALPQRTKTYWTEVVRETARQLGKHPAVMGFTIHNEQDGADVCYNNRDWADFWWGQTESLAAIVKQEAPGKLVGMATHDDPLIPARASSWMAKCAHIDFWGVNTYQTVNFDNVFGPYSALTGGALKPVILTEYGIPATSRRTASNPATIYDDAATCQKTAEVIRRVAPKAYEHPLSLGLYYFEYCDEWWNQHEAPNIYTWWSGKPNSGFPNGYWDNDGFGLHSIRRGQGLKPSDDPWDRIGPRKPIDVHTQRPATFNALANVFKNVK